MITHATQEAMRVSHSISQGACDECDVYGPRVLGVVAIAFTFKYSLTVDVSPAGLHAHSVAMGAVFSCIFLLILITAMATGVYFSRASTTVKNKCVRGVVST